MAGNIAVQTAGRVTRTNRHSWLERLRRLFRYRLVVPLQRSRHPPEFSARGVSVGLFWALTPTVGIQMAIVCLHWLVSRWLFRHDFAVIQACAWTWISNIATVIPIYYLFYVTGQILLGRWDDISGWVGFNELWHPAFGSEIAYVDRIDLYYRTIVKGWGLALLVGWVPWAVGGAWIGYSWSLGLIRRIRAARLARRLRRRPHVVLHRHGPHGHDDAGEPAQTD